MRFAHMHFPRNTLMHRQKKKSTYFQKVLVNSRHCRESERVLARARVRERERSSIEREQS